MKAVKYNKYITNEQAEYHVSPLLKAVIEVYFKVYCNFLYVGVTSFLAYRLPSPPTSKVYPKHINTFLTPKTFIVFSYSYSLKTTLWQTQLSKFDNKLIL